MPPGWLKSGYKKKEKCDKCGFRFKHTDQASVYHIDGNSNNNDWTNLKTICANCGIDVKHSKLPWVPSDLVPDF